MHNFIRSSLRILKRRPAVKYAIIHVTGDNMEMKMLDHLPRRDSISWRLIGDWLERSG